jgi:hypothetical protein
LWIKGRRILQGLDQKGQRYQLFQKIFFLFWNNSSLLVDVLEDQTINKEESDVTRYMNVPTSYIMPTWQLSLFFQEIGRTLLASSFLGNSLLLSKTSRQGSQPVWINTWSLSDIQENDAFLNILKEATNTGSSNHERTVYMVSSMYRSEYLDFASKMDWIHVTETSEIMYQSSNLYFVFVGFPTNLQKFEAFLYLVKENLIIITEFKWER